jgi:hypothetical protein
MEKTSKIFTNIREPVVVSIKFAETFNESKRKGHIVNISVEDM